MITTAQIGETKDVLLVELGDGDVMFHEGQSPDLPHCLLFTNGGDGEIGKTTDEFKGYKSDELPNPVKLAINFKNPQSVAALIHSLIKLQKSMF